MTNGDENICQSQNGECNKLERQCH